MNLIYFCFSLFFSFIDMDDNEKSTFLYHKK